MQDIMGSHAKNSLFSADLDRGKGEWIYETQIGIRPVVMYTLHSLCTYGNAAGSLNINWLCISTANFLFHFHHPDLRYGIVRLC